MKKYQRFLSENFQFLEVNFSIYLNRRVFIMDCADAQADQLSVFAVRICPKTHFLMARLI